jgi:hypothetical protein
LISLVFPGGFSRRFFQACHLSFPTVEGFFHNFPLFFKDFPSFSLVFSYLFPTVFKGPESNPTVTKLPSDTFPQKKTFGWPNHYQISSSRSTPLYSLRSRKQLCLAYRLAFVKN